MSCLKAEIPIEQGNRQYVAEIDVGHASIVYDSTLGCCGKTDDDAFHILRRKTIFTH